MLFAMTHVILALVLNLYSSAWVDPAGVLAEPRTKLVTGLNILIDSLFAFPAAWAGICAAVSRHRGVYILLMVIVSLCTLGCIGGLVAIAYEFSIQSLFRDANSQNDEVAISMLVMRSIEIIVSLMLLIFGVVAVLSDLPQRSPSGKYYEGGEMLVAEPPQYNSAMRAPSYASYQGQMRGGASAPRVSGPASVGGFRQYTKGSPEWDKFYSEYFGSGNRSYGGDLKGKSKHRSNSYRY